VPRFWPSQQLRGDVEANRVAFLEEIESIASDRLIFIDESGGNIAMSPVHGRKRGQRVIEHEPANWEENASIFGAVRAARSTTFVPITRRGPLRGREWRARRQLQGARGRLRPPRRAHR